jgi:hypothetical protein
LDRIIDLGDLIDVLTYLYIITQYSP